MVVFGKLAKLLLCYKRYVLSHPCLHLPPGEWGLLYQELLKYYSTLPFTKASS